MSHHDIAVSVRGLSKSYTIAHNAPKHTTLGEALVQTLKNPRRRLETETFWALKDVDFDIHKGDVVGIIGRNGAGKSTLLKVLSRITEPTTGQIDIYGRVGSLLEVGTGFHPELTGRENIFMNGAILGMSRREITKHFDDIVEFAEVEQFLDTPVKRYSSGMYVRLAFAVAAHLNPEILIVDEVLAVGDAAFQRKCLGKMKDVAHHEGRTVLFVSHNMGAVTSLCSRAIMLSSGQIEIDAPTAEVISHYQYSQLHSTNSYVDLRDVRREGTGDAKFTAVTVKPLSRDNEPVAAVFSGGDLLIETEILCETSLIESNVAVTIYDASGYRLIDVNTALAGSFLTMVSSEVVTASFVLHNLLLRPGTYVIELWLGRAGIGASDKVEYAASFTVVDAIEGKQHVETFPGTYQCRFESNVRYKTEQNSDRGLAEYSTIG